MTQTRRILGTTAALTTLALALSAAPSQAQTQQAQTAQTKTAPKQGANSKTPPPTPPPAPAPNYVIGPDDLLTVTVWHAAELSGDVRVRPDGKITLSAGNDIQASGLTTEQLKAAVIAEVKRCCYADPDVFIQSKEIHSRNFYVQGSGIAKPGIYPLAGPLTVVQAVTMAGGLNEFAHKKDMLLISGTLKNKDGSPLTWKINYEDLENGRNVAKYNIELRPGDTLIVR